MVKKVLIACEESQAICIEMRKHGAEAYSCDIIECSGGHPEWHIKGDALPLINGNCTFKTMDGAEHTIDGKWDLLISHPPCTDLCVSGARHFERKRNDGSQRESIEFFCKFLKADCERVVIENPVGIISGDYIKKWFPDLCEKYGLPLKPAQSIQPWMFGDNFSKTTLLWIKGLNNLTAEFTEQPELEWREWVDGKTGKIKRQPLWYYKAKHGKGKGKERSKTFPGIARAFTQWLYEIEEDG